MPRSTRRPPDVALAATLHDPRGALVREARRALPVLARLYRHVVVATSPPTAAAMNAVLDRAGAFAGTPSANLRGPLYRLSLRAALATGAAHVHYLDFDRAVHWVATAPRELGAVVRLAARRPCLWIGRTARAHASHHRALHATEAVVNRLVADRLGVAGRLDVLVPSFVLDRERAARLLAGSRTRDAAVYGELAALLAGLDPAPAYLECRGLEWETPDRHRRAVLRLGLAEWRRRQDTPAEWALRTELATVILRGFERTLARGPLPRLAPVRLPPRAGTERASGSRGGWRRAHARA